jgi:ABC-type glutathione transport system ATPase component
MTDPGTKAESGDRATPIIQVNGVSQRYPLPRTRLFAPRPHLQALDDVTLDIHLGTALGIVGESGAGKTTLTRILVGSERPTSGTVTFDGADLWQGGPELRRRFRRSVQIVLQNPRSCFDPRMRVGQSLLEPLRSLGIDGDHVERVGEMLNRVGLDIDTVRRYPHEFSGGQLQRLAIARALLPGPKVLIADEPVSALDVSVQAQVLNLLMDLVEQLGVALVLIAHDLSVVTYTTSRVAVIDGGRIVEEGSPRAIFVNPQHAATQKLTDAVLTVAGGLAKESLR